MKKTIVSLGKITLGNEVMVSDPSYKIGIWCQAKLDNVLEGAYVVCIEKIDTEDWGIRNSRLIVLHENYVPTMNADDWIIHPTEIGVDSGQAGIFSIETFRNDKVEIKTPEKTYDGRNFAFPVEEEGDAWYQKMCRMTLADLQSSYGTYENGVVCTSGLGDGGYVLMVAQNVEGKIVGMTIDFQVEATADYIDENF
jgi:hypothetical protein